MKRLAVALLASVFVGCISPAIEAAEPELAHAPFTFELWPNGTLTAMQPKSEAT